MAKRFLVAGGVVLLFFLLCGVALGQGVEPVGYTTPSGQEFAPDQLLVRFQPWVTAQRADQLMAGQGASRIRHIRGLGVHVLHLPPGLSVERALEIFGNLPEVEFAEPNYVMQTLAPSEVEIEDQWGLKKIQAPEAWAQIPNQDPVLLAIVDTGIDRNHPDLADNIWTNDDPPGDADGNGDPDDDGNGYVDDTWGWDFQNNDNDPTDDNMHGTACSSVAAAVQDESGVAGVCPWCTLVAVKVIGADGSGYLDTVATGIIYAADNGARVISLSVGGPGSAQTLENAVNYAWNKGALVVAAAGNEGTSTLIYPAAYANAMAIASTNDQDYRSCFSNYRAGYISVAAPGQSILVAVPPFKCAEGVSPPCYGTYSGTSLSTPHVAGLGGLLFSQNSARTNTDVRSIIETTVNDLGPTGTDAYFGSGRINAYRAVTNETTPTDPPVGLFSDDLTASGYAHARKLARDADGTLHLVWHGRDGGQYRVLYATSDDGGENWSEPYVVFHSSAETYHPALAIGGDDVYIAFPSKHNGSGYYQTFFIKKDMDGWSEAVALMGGTYHAVRPDLYYDPSNGRLHLVASSFDDAPYVYYRWSEDGGESWSTISQVTVGPVGQLTRNADVHASGSNIYVTGRTVEFWLGILPYYRVFTIRSLDGGETWVDLTELAYHQGLFTGAYGVSLAGVGDQLDLAYEHNGAVYFRHSLGGVGWSEATPIGSGAWPSVTQASDGQAWVMWESGGELSLRHYTGAAWDPTETVGGGNYPNLKLGTTGGFVEWAATYCSGAPFRLIYDSRTIVANDPPVASAGGPYSGAEGGAIVFDGSGSSDPDGDSLIYDWDFGDGTIGTGVSPSHAYEYGGTFIVTLTVTDGKGGVDTGSTTATVEEVNDAPVADPNGPYSGTTGDPIIFDGSGSFDPDNQDGTTTNDQTLSYAWDFGDETTGSGLSPSHTYDAGGEYTVTLVVSDGVTESAPATTNASVTKANNPPVADDVTASGDEDTIIPWTPSVSDSDGDSLTCSVVSQPSSGSASVNPDCSSGTYTPNQDFNGDDPFSYKANDGSVDSNTATVSITVMPVNDGAVANDDSATTPEEAAVTINVVSNDTDVDGNLNPASANTACDTCSDASHGTLVNNGDGTFTYTPGVDFVGDDSFVYEVCDTGLLCDTATVSVTVNPVNDGPVANDDSATTPEETAVTINVVSNDTDVDGNLDPASATLLSGPSNGSVENSGDGTFTYTPGVDFVGDDSFTYEVCDTGGLCDTANVTVTVNPVSMHVGDLDGYVTSLRNKWTANVIVTVHDASHDPVGGATVTGTWSNGAPGSCQRTTDISGQCLISQGGIAKKIPSVVFTVDAVTHATLGYDPNGNHDPDGDSNGTSITVYLELPTNQPPVASFTYTCTDLTCDFDASSSYDPDGSIVGYDWNFGDGIGESSDATARYTYSTDGIYTVILTVTDDGGATDTDTQSVMVGEAGPAMHVGDLDGEGMKLPQGYWGASVTITVHDVSHAEVVGATVVGRFYQNGTYVGPGSCETEVGGICTVNSGQLPSKGGQATFTVTSVTHDAFAYNAAANHDPDGDSDGTRITVSK